MIMAKSGTKGLSPPVGTNSLVLATHIAPVNVKCSAWYPFLLLVVNELYFLVDFYQFQDVVIGAISNIF